MKLKPKAAKLEKQNLPTKKNKNKVKRSDHRNYLEYFHQQGHKCIVCGTDKNIEAHHCVPSDNRTIVSLCSYCHRGDEREGRRIQAGAYRNTRAIVGKGYFCHRGSESKAFRHNFPDEYLMQIARQNYLEYKSKKC